MANVAPRCGKKSGSLTTRRINRRGGAAFIICDSPDFGPGFLLWTEQIAPTFDSVADTPQSKQQDTMEHIRCD